ncbi:peptide chain release factor 1 [Desulfitibacter alkalitolerans]|uniref:peptide chain release factor 1 n=1 Tax=Desulfitibacter alkalitolerans TaxID=264641 RepID=UPI000488BD91|nr:peptide chain release factor 1 [Desulfitibacter alkalitolerans]
MFDKLESIEKKYDELTMMMTDTNVLSNQKELQRVAKAHSDLQEIVSTYRAYKKAERDYIEADSLIKEGGLEPDFKEMVEMEKEEAAETKKNLTEKLRILLLPKDPNDSKNVIMEIRAGAGGDEAALFAGDLFKLYVKYAENKGWKVEVLSAHETDIGGFKEVAFLIEGNGAYSLLKYESGVHRVQRIPSTESGGRIHTSTATVAVLPEAEEVDVEIDPNDLRIDVFCSSGPGGQSVNTTQSAVRVTHIPSGIVVSCQDEKSQLKNKEKALKVLRAKLYEKAQEEQQQAMAGNRKSQVGTGDRSERIRTFNYPQGRVTDHRIGLTLHKLDMILLGDIQEIIDALIAHDQSEQLKDVE